MLPCDPANASYRHNDGAQKAYGDLYRRVCDEFRLPAHVLTELYGTPFIRHFYSDAERERSYQRWVRPAPLGRPAAMPGDAQSG